MTVDEIRSALVGAGATANETDYAKSGTHVDATVDAETLRAAVSEPVHLRSRDVQVTASLGVAHFRVDRERPENLLKDAEIARQETEEAEQRRSLVGSGDRSERIRSYNFPEGRVTDHRIDLKLYRLGEILEGNLGLLIEPLTNEHQADQLAAVGVLQ